MRQTAALFFVEIMTTSVLQTNLPKEVVTLVNTVEYWTDEAHKTLSKYKFTEKRMKKLYDNLAIVIREYGQRYEGLPVCLGIVASLCLVDGINFQYRRAGINKREWLGLEESLNDLYLFYDPELREKELISLGEEMSDKFENIIRKM